MLAGELSVHLSCLEDNGFQKRTYRFDFVYKLSFISVNFSLLILFRTVVETVSLEDCLKDSLPGIILGISGPLPTSAVLPTLCSCIR